MRVMKAAYMIFIILSLAVFYMLCLVHKIPFMFINVILFFAAPVSYFYKKLFSYHLAAVSLATLPAVSVFLLKIDIFNAVLPVMIFSGFEIGIMRCREIVDAMRKAMDEKMKNADDDRIALAGEFEAIKINEKEMMEKELAIVSLYELTKKMSGALKFSDIFDIFSAFLKENFNFRKSDLLILPPESEGFRIERAYSVWGSGHNSSSKAAVNYARLMKLFSENPTKAVYATWEDTKAALEDMGVESPEVETFTCIPIIGPNRLVALLTAENLPKSEFEKFVILSMELRFEIKKVLLYETVEKLAITDSLTGLFVRRYFIERLNEELRRSESYKLGFAFLMIDIDDFKKCNDTYGHLVGDVVLNGIARIIKESIREIDLCARYGGEEFAILLPETTPEGAKVVAERIRKRIEETGFRAYDENPKLTISAGISVYPNDSKDATGLIDKADKALYNAKRSGKNLVCGYRK